MESIEKNGGSANIRTTFLQRKTYSNFEECKDLLKFTRSLFKGSLSGLMQFLATESPLKMMKNAFYFILKSCFCSHEI